MDYIKPAAIGAIAICLVPAAIDASMYIYKHVDPAVGAMGAAVIGVGMAITKMPNMAPMTSAEFWAGFS